MAQRKILPVHWLLLFLIIRPITFSQLATPGPPQRLASLQQLSRKSGYIFSGTVLSVKKLAPSSPTAVATVQVTFQVSEAVRGVRAGQQLKIREWGGLWNAGQQYRPGEKVFLYLYPPSKLGLTSTVAGSGGRFGIDNYGDVIPPPSRGDDWGEKILPLIKNRRLSEHQACGRGVRP